MSGGSLLELNHQFVELVRCMSIRWFAHVGLSLSDLLDTAMPGISITTSSV